MRSYIHCDKPYDACPRSSMQSKFNIYAIYKEKKNAEICLVIPNMRSFFIVASFGIFLLKKKKLNIIGTNHLNN